MVTFFGETIFLEIYWHAKNRLINRQSISRIGSPPPYGQPDCKFPVFVFEGFLKWTKNLLISIPLRKVSKKSGKCLVFNQISGGTYISDVVFFGEGSKIFKVC